MQSLGAMHGPADLIACLEVQESQLQQVLCLRPETHPLAVNRKQGHASC